MDYVHYKGNWQKTKKLENKIMFEFSDNYYYPAYVISNVTMGIKEPTGNLTVNFGFNFFTKSIDYYPKDFVAESISLNQLSNTDFLDQSKDYKSDFILETEQERQLLQR